MSLIEETTAQEIWEKIPPWLAAADVSQRAVINRTKEALRNGWEPAHLVAYITMDLGPQATGVLIHSRLKAAASHTMKILDGSDMAPVDIPPRAPFPPGPPIIATPAPADIVKAIRDDLRERHERVVYGPMTLEQHRLAVARARAADDRRAR
jgi:hypothetical protein